MDNTYLHAWYVLLICISIGSLCSDISARDLIENGSFEADGPFSTVANAGWDDGPTRANEVGFVTNLWPFFENGEIAGGNLAWELPPDFPHGEFQQERLRPMGAGDVFAKSWGAANGDGRFGSATQHVVLSQFADTPYVFSAWLASATRDADHAVVSLEFFAGEHATGSSLGSVLFDGNDQQSEFIVGALNLDGLADPTIPATQDNWTFYRASGDIPFDAQSAAVVIRSPMIEGSNNGEDAYVDLVSLQVVPEPASVVVLAILAAIVIARRCRMALHRVAARPS